jgi:hypothetical protein
MLAADTIADERYVASPHFPAVAPCIDTHFTARYAQCTECQSPGSTIKVVALLLLIAASLGAVYAALGYKLAEAAVDEEARICTGVALVIGNTSKYNDSWRPIDAAAADAIAVSGALRTQGYRVIEVHEGSQADILAAVASFKAALGEEQAKRDEEQEAQEEQEEQETKFPDVAGLIFYSGHGTHIDVRSVCAAGLGSFLGFASPLLRFLLSLLHLSFFLSF